MLTALSPGNPYAVLLLDDDPADFPLERVAPAIQSHPLLPSRVDVEIARVEGRDRLCDRVFERGEGETLASGATACAVAPCLHGLTGEGVAVELPGGVLRVEWAGPGETAWLEGPAVEVFEGVWPLTQGAGG